MKKFHVIINGNDFGVFLAFDSNDAFNQAAQLAGYESRYEYSCALGQFQDFICVAV